MATPAERENLLMEAKLCESACRYDEMTDAIRELVMKLPKKEKLTSDEKKLLANSYKHEINSRRISLKNIKKSAHTLGTYDTEKLKVLNDYKRTITEELEAICKDLISLLDSKLLPEVNAPADDIFYHKLKGDYCRYLAEVETDTEEVNLLIDKVKENYQAATEFAEKSLSATDPVQIGLAMNYSVFMHEMLNNTPGALEHAKRFYDNALDELETVQEVDDTRYNECAYILRLMHENIKVWTAETTVSKTPKQLTSSTRQNDF